MRIAPVALLAVFGCYRAPHASTTPLVDLGCMYDAATETMRVCLEPGLLGTCQTFGAQCRGRYPGKLAEREDMPVYRSSPYYQHTPLDPARTTAPDPGTWPTAPYVITTAQPVYYAGFAEDFEEPVGAHGAPSYTSPMPPPKPHPEPPRPNSRPNGYANPTGTPPVHPDPWGGATVVSGDTGTHHPPFPPSRPGVFTGDTGDTVAPPQPLPPNRPNTALDEHPRPILVRPVVPARPATQAAPASSSGSHPTYRAGGHRR